MDDVEKNLAAMAETLDRHERAIVELKLGVASIMSGTTARLEETERRIIHHGEKLEELVNETAGQSVTLEEIKGMVCSHKDDQAQQLIEHGKTLVDLGAAKAAGLAKMEKVEGDVATVKRAVDGVGTDMELVKKAVVHGAAHINAMRAYRILVCMTIIVGGSVILSILWAFPQLIPLMVKVFERVVTGGAH